jgi:polysaccharide biosynthesis transport protein
MTQAADMGEVKMNVSRDHQEVFDLGLALRALRRRLGTVLIVVVVVNAITACALLVLPTTYSATASLMVDPAMGGTISGKPAAKSLPDWLPGDNSVMATQVDILKSPELAQHLITRLGLQDDVEFWAYR